MKKKFWIEMTGIFFLAGLLSCQQDVKETRLMSYNVKNGQGMDGFADYGRTANVILKEKPDVVALQELDSATMRSKGAYVLGELAQRTGMHATYAPAINFDGGKYGIGILSKERPLNICSKALPGREEARTMLITEFKDYIYVCMHLSLTEEDRMASLPIIREALSGFHKPVFIAGDWNDTPESALLQEIEKDFTILTDTASPTYPADQPDSTLDYIAAYRPSIHIKESKGYVTEATSESDHRPVTVVIKWTE